MTAKDESKIAALLASLWERGLPALRERLDILDRAAMAASLGELTEALRIEAVEVAHKLSGSLGMFGYGHGTEIARKIEQILDARNLTVPGSLSALVTELRETLQVKIELSADRFLNVAIEAFLAEEQKKRPGD